MLRIAKKFGSSNNNSNERLTVNLDDMASMFCVLVSRLDNLVSISISLENILMNIFIPAPNVVKPFPPPSKNVTFN